MAANFNLHQLGWDGFQRLCLTIAREILGQTVLSFLDCNDGGRDGAFEGIWKRTKSEVLEGKFVIQCKHTSRPDHNLTLSDLGDELEKAGRLAKAGRCDVYILMTNTGVSGSTEEALSDAFAAVGITAFRCFGYSWICQEIKDTKRLRMSVPRLYGLGDLTQILDERAYQQARAVLESLREDLAKVVLTGTYHRAADALDKYGFLFLVGEPASGNTTISETLAVAATDQWNCSVVKIDEPSEIVDHWNPEEPSQFFWVDDAFGTTHHEPVRVHSWNRVFSQVKAAIQKGARIVMTSRDYIYGRARLDIKEGMFPLLRKAQVVIDVQELTLQERRQILYNHVKLGAQPRAFRSTIKPYLEIVAEHPRFIPEIARRLATPFFTQHLVISRQDLTNFVERREHLLREVLAGLDADSKAALGLIFMGNGVLLSPVQIGLPQEEAIARLGSTLGGCVQALQSLRDSLVRYTTVDSNPAWIFKHPTIADAFSELLLSQPELMGIFLVGAPVEKLLGQVTCGDVGLEGALVVPRSLRGLFSKRLLETEYNWEAERREDWFLTYRCDKEFLSEFLKKRPSILERVKKPGLYLNAVSEVDLAVRMFELGLLREGDRRVFIAAVTEYAVRGQDLYALESTGIRSMLTRSELRNLRARVRKDMIPTLSYVRRDADQDWDHEEDPADHMQRYMDMLDTLHKQFRRYSIIVAEVERQRNAASFWVSEHEPPDSELPARVKLSEEAQEMAPPIADARSIFDDIDA